MAPRKGPAAAPGKKKATPGPRAAKMGDNQPDAAQVRADDLETFRRIEHHAKVYTRELADKKEQDANFKNACKKAVDDLGDDAVDMIKAHLALKDEKKSAKWKKHIEAMVRVARWSGEPIGFQGNLFGNPDLRTSAERAREEGKQAGLRGEAGKPPEHWAADDMREWLAGHAEGQDFLMKGIKQKPESDNSAVH